MARLKPLAAARPQIVARLARARSLAVACDFDGTLAPIVARPGEAAFPPRARRALARLARTPGVRVAVLSGRALDDLARLVRIPGVHLAGASGLESRDARGRRTRHVPAGRGLPAELRERLEAWCARFPGAWLEDKGPTWALHDRAVAASRRRAFGAGVRRIVAASGARALVVAGRMVFEVMPDVGWDKSAALRRWLGPRARPLVVYGGDDAVDEPAFAAVRRRGGIAIAVDRRSPNAEYFARDAAEITEFLEWLAREWRAGTGRVKVRASAARGSRARAAGPRGRRSVA